MNECFDQQEMINILMDAGMEEEKINEFIKSIDNDYKAKSRMILNDQRKVLLLDLHSQEDKLDCLDYLISKLKKLKII
ncbi:hypothetical protein [Thomasclavelia sp.]|uniref:hypothetical protein n=1 Tax=Thomasclavelia sp. TaxID=3025757 RepID=UPI0025F766AE|nr:hypothetical protein [Thomasclavelia sp.]